MGNIAFILTLAFLVIAPYLLFFIVPRSIIYLLLFFLKRHYISKRDKYLITASLWGVFFGVILWNNDFELIHYSGISAILAVYIPIVVIICGIIVYFQRSSKKSFDLYYIIKTNSQPLIDQFHHNYEETPEVVFTRNYVVPQSITFRSINRKRANEILKEVNKAPEAFQAFNSKSSIKKLTGKFYELCYSLFAFGFLIYVMYLVEQGTPL